MKIWFVSYFVEGHEVLHRFRSIVDFWAWLQKYKNERDEYPPQVCIYTGECVFDGS